MRVITRLTVVLALLPVWTVTAVMRPSWACACGALITSGPKAEVAGETSIVRFDDRSGTEQIVLRLSVRSQAEDAAWLLPTPSAAQVRLGERSWFTRLDRLTAPRVVTQRRWFPGLRIGGRGGTGPDTPGDGGVVVLAERHLRPFTVATLSADDPAALAGWLRDNGYRLGPGLKQALAGYAGRGWKYVAVKLDPGKGQTLQGDLDPLHVTFKTRELIYPMRLSRFATSPRAVHLYVLAPHRVERTQPRFPGDEIPFAGWIEPAQAGDPEFARFIGGRLFVTETLIRHLEPTSITDDFRYRFTADTTYQQVIYRTEAIKIFGLPGGWVLAAGGLAVAVVLAIGTPLLFTRGRRRRA